MNLPDLNYVKRELQASVAVKQAVLADSTLVQLITDTGQLLIRAYEAGHKLLIAGNGGSAADAQHIAAEFVGQFNFDRPGLPALALTTDSSVMTSVSNDYGYDKVFRRQVEVHGAAGDVFLGISTSGNSANILEAAQAAQSRGLVTIGLTGQAGGKLHDLCDYCICVPSNDTPRVQEAHMLIGHTLCAMAELAIFGEGIKHG
jgi:D-sedoheptulose 7-phosphate isomerase